MTVPALPRRWCEILALAGLTFGFTAILVRGAEPEQCGTNSLCGHGARCDTNTTQCVCLSDDGELTNRKGSPFSLYYCLGGEVTECGHQLCGYRAECNTDRSECRCSFNNAEPRELKGTSPSLWYCVEKCDLRGSMCPDNTTCRNSSVNNRHLCQCSEEATQSSTGQCLGKPSNVHVTTEGDSPTQSDDSRILTIGLAAGIGGVVLVAVIVLIVVVLARRRASRRASDNEMARLRRQSSPPHPSRAPSRHTYQTVVDPPLPGQSGMNNPAGPMVVVRTEVSVINPPSRPRAYEDVDNDFPVIYSTAKVSDKRNKNKANQAQQANNAIRLPSQPGDKAEPKNFKDLYSNDAIPFNKTHQRKKEKEGSSENMENQYNTLYDLRPVESNTAGTALRGDLEYDEIKLQIV